MSLVTVGCVTFDLILPAAHYRQSVLFHELDFGKYRRNECLWCILDCAELIKMVILFVF